MAWFAFPIAGAFIGGFIGLAICGCHGAGSGDSIGAVAGLFFTAIGGGVGLIVGGIGAGAATMANAGNREESSTDHGNAAEWIHGVARCPRSGVWVARVTDSHPLASVFNVWNRTAKVTAGERFPNPATMLAGVATADVKWKCVDDFAD